MVKALKKIFTIDPFYYSFDIIRTLLLWVMFNNYS